MALYDKLWGGTLVARKHEMRMLGELVVAALVSSGQMNRQMTRREFKRNKELFEPLLAKVANYLYKIPNAHNNKYSNKRKLSDYELCTNYRYKYRRDDLYSKLDWSWSDTEEFSRLAKNVNAKVRKKAHAIVDMMPISL